MLVISSTTLTLEVSTKPCFSVPVPLVPAAPSVAVPDAVVSTNRFWPCGSRPAGFTKLASWIWPTVVEAVAADGRIMAEEIFGPILPVLECDSLEESIAFVNARPRPLALYYFSRDRGRQERVVRETSSGGVCLNDAIVQISFDRRFRFKKYLIMTFSIRQDIDGYVQIINQH